MSLIRYTLLTDGPSDRCLTRIINRVLNDTPFAQECGFTAFEREARRTIDALRQDS